MSTLAKLFAADYWIVLDDVQFTRRDYQHRARLAALDDPDRTQWLTIPTHLPQGRATLIRDAVMLDPGRSQRRTAQLIAQHYRSSPHWPLLRDALQPVLDGFHTTDRTSHIAEASTTALLHLLGWKGQILRSSQLPARMGRSERLADLAAATGASVYLCGTGGLSYLDSAPFGQVGIPVRAFRLPEQEPWLGARRNSALELLMRCSPSALTRSLVFNYP